MAKNKRIHAGYPGVYYRIAQRIGKSGEERVYYIVFKKEGKMIEEKVGRQFVDNMTPAKASGIRADRIEGRRESRKELREKTLAAKRAEDEKVTIAKLWQYYQEGNSNRKSFKTDDCNYELYLHNRFALQEPAEITTLHIDGLRIILIKEGKAPQTVKHILGLLRRIIRFGVKRGLCPAPNPAKQHFEMPKVDNLQTESMNAEQLQKYLHALDQESDQDATAFLRLALLTGLRKGALLGLRWDDIDFERGFITLRGETAKKGKTDKIPLSQSAQEVVLNITRTESIYVFPGKDGGQRKDYKRIAQRVRDNAGLPKTFRPIHGLRHTYASLLASSGKVDLYTLQKLLTHESPQMTQRYAHLADEALQRAARVSDSIFSVKENKDTE